MVLFFGVLFVEGWGSPGPGFLFLSLARSGEPW